MQTPPPGAARPRKPFGRARPARDPEANLDTPTRLRLRLQRKVADMERRAMRLAIHGKTMDADALIQSAQRLKALQKPAGK